MFDLAALFASLKAHQIEYVVIGGAAVAAHGYIRATKDLDIVPEPSAENHARLAELLDELEATLPIGNGRRFDSTADLAALRKGGNLTLDTKLGALDIIQRAAGVPRYSALAADAVPTDLLGVPVKVC